MPPNSDKELASKAKSEFLKSNYANCLELLEKLSVKNDDLKLMHNKAVVEFYKSGTKQTGALQDALKAVFQKAKLRPERLSTLEDVDNCGLYYNYAVVLYHQRQYRRALSILSKIFKYIEPLDDSTAKRIGLLLVECCLCSHQPNMALDVIKVVESKFLSKPEDVKRKDGTRTGLYSRIQRCRCRALLQLHNTTELTPLLAQLPNTSVYLAFLESYSEYLNGRGREAVACLGRIASMRRPSFADTGEHTATMYYNNLACVHHCCLNRPTVACHYLQTALAENQTATASAKTEGGSAGSLHTIGGSRHYELLYNAGITLLHAGRPRRAFDCLTEAIQVYHTNPRLWLRLAECCIMVYRQDRYGERGSEFDSPSLIEGKLGAGQHRKLIIHGSSVTSSSDQISAAIPNPTMEFASLALRNAWLILGEDGEGECPVTVEPANPVTPDQVQTIRCSVLAAAVFVHLCLQEPLLALEQAAKLLQQRLLAPAQKLLARLYAAEALLLLDRSDEALRHLSCPASPQQQQPTSPPAAAQTPTEDPDESPLSLHNADVVCSPVQLSWRPNTQLGARMCLQYNMAVARARRVELDKTWELLKTMNPASADVPPQVIQLALYIQLRLGNLDMVRSIIKQHVPRGK